MEGFLSTNNSPVRQQTLGFWLPSRCPVLALCYIFTSKPTALSSCVCFIRSGSPACGRVWCLEVKLPGTPLLACFPLLTCSLGVYYIALNDRLRFQLRVTCWTTPWSLRLSVRLGLRLPSPTLPFILCPPSHHFRQGFPPPSCSQLLFGALQFCLSCPVGFKSFHF